MNVIRQYFNKRRPQTFSNIVIALNYLFVFHILNILMQAGK